MSANSSTEPSESIENDDFNLKHRISGAAVLLFLGAAVLPWLLGPPSEASKIEEEAVVASSAALSPGIQEADLLIDGVAGINVKESVYVSKITPFDGDRKTGLRETVTTTSIVKVVPSAEENTHKTTTTKTNLSGGGANRKVNAAKKDELKRPEKAPSKVASAQEKTPTDVVDVGWIVQVGLFTEKNRAIAFIAELKNRGFNASSNVVDTNRGKNTGTRVWLGPFARKSNAANEVKRLKSKAGKDGFIRVYP